jgi:ribose 5-phosphate isomerase A
MKAKQKASYMAIDQRVNSSTKVIGIGSGSTIKYAVERLGQVNKTNGIDIIACIPSSFQAQQLILENNLPLGTLNQYPAIDVAFDGADEVDANLNCIKGGGGCHLQEKLVISNAKQFFIVCDDRKDSLRLTDKWKKIPIEVIPSVYVAVSNKLKAIGGQPDLRMAVNKAGPVVTDNGMFILDTAFPAVNDFVALDHKLHEIVGIVETGLFCGMANGCYFGLQDGTVKYKNKDAP